IDTALFTNLTLDHLDYHGSMEAYWAAKTELFAWPGLRAAVINIDDAHGARLARSLSGGSLDVWTYSTVSDARLRASNIGYAAGGLGFDLREGDATVAVKTQMIGDYNVANLLATIGGLRASGIPLADAAATCALLTPVPGRMQRIASDAAGPQVVVDYAHTPDALEKALLALQPFAAERGGALWCVFGCGGNRDQGKRPLMGALAQRLATQVVITSDNPRNEAPAFILLQIVAGLAGSQERVKVIEDRRAAIAHAVRNAGARDVILVAGKGHEDYQEIKGVKQHFSDVEEAAAALRTREGAPA
ncbi:MAG: UDP-N-acetylmuramoyl-L-alanyl-D-glutamate--2,6-diaminopimelate ligase, partial [Burkholderiales bacterium]